MKVDDRVDRKTNDNRKKSWVSVFSKMITEKYLYLCAGIPAAVGSLFAKG